MATYGTFIAKVRSELEEDTASVWSDQNLMDWTNEAIREFGTKVMLDFDEQYTDSVAGQESYTMPARTSEVIRVVYDDVFLNRIKESQYFLGPVAATTPGTPNSYCVTRDTLYLYPPPDTDGTTIRMFRRYWPDVTYPIANTSATMPWGSEYDSVLGYYVKARAYEMEGDTDLVKMNDELYNRGLDDAVFYNLYGTTGDYYWEPAVVW